MVIKYSMKWFETACIFILVKEDAFHDANLMGNESNSNFSSDLGVSIYSIQYLLTILIHILFTSLSQESKNEDLRDYSIDFNSFAMEESRKSSFLASQDEDVSKMQTSMVSKY